MRIFYISTSFIPSRSANSIQVMKMCQALVRVGESVELLAPDYSSDELKEKIIWDYYGIQSPFALIKIKAISIFRGNDYVVQSILYAWSKNADIVYTRNVKVAMLTALLGINTIYEAHMPAIGGLSPLYYRILSRCSKFLKLVVISEALKDYFCSLSRHASLEKIILARDAVDFEEFRHCLSKKEARKKLGLPGKAFLIGYVGQLYPGKGMETIFQLAQRITEQFIIVGGKPLDIDKWKDKTKDFKNIEFTGFVPHREVREYISSFDVLLMPYQTKVLGSSGKQDIGSWMSPMKMFEYMAGRRPIIASDLSVIREVLRHEENAILVDPLDVDSWIQQIKRLKDNAKLGQTLAQRAWDEAREKYTWERRVKIIFSELKIANA